MAKKKTTTKHDSMTEGLRPVYLTQYEITDEAIEDGVYKRLPELVKDQLERLYQEAQWKPKQAIPELLELKQKYSKVTQIYNYLTVAYVRTGEIEKAEAIMEEGLRKNPTYLFGRLNYAEFCLGRKEYEKIPEIFEHKYDLQVLYPKRKRFHISEVANFMGLMGTYFARTNQRGIAESYNNILQEIAPGFPMAKRLNRELYPRLITRILKRLLGE